MRAGTRRHRWLIPRMMISRLDGRATPTPHLRHHPARTGLSAC
jgi:hypothetical protein